MLMFVSQTPVHIFPQSAQWHKNNKNKNRKQLVFMYLYHSLPAGGFDGSMPLNTAEYYDPKVGKWTEIARMNQCRFGVGCAVLNDMVYAIGGSDGTNLKTVERYDPDSNTWKMLASMSTAR